MADSMHSWLLVLLVVVLVVLCAVCCLCWISLFSFSPLSVQQPQQRQSPAIRSIQRTHSTHSSSHKHGNQKGLVRLKHEHSDRDSMRQRPRRNSVSEAASDQPVSSSWMGSGVVERSTVDECVQVCTAVRVLRSRWATLRSAAVAPSLISALRCRCRLSVLFAVAAIICSNSC